MRRIVLLLIVMMFAGCAENNPDQDGDGLTDSQEEGGSLIVITYMDLREERVVSSDPTMADTDGDGLLDVHEVLVNGDPRNKDTDGDGLTDCQEAQHTNVTECEDPNWEGETDGGYGTAVNIADSDRTAGRYKRSLPFTDLTDGPPLARGDGISDYDEIMGYWVDLPTGRRFIQSNPLEPDTDADYLEDGEELYQYGSHPLIADSDEDGCMDGRDLFPAYDTKLNLNLQSFTWSEAGQSGTVDTLWRMLIADTILPHPGANDAPWSIQHGKTYTAEELTTPDADPAQCSYPPYEPWVRIDLIIERREGDATHVLDVYSDSNPVDERDGLGRYSVWWNPREDLFSWQLEGETFSQFETWNGPDGEITFKPVVVGLPSI